MPVIKCLSYNVKGLNSPSKRHKVLEELKRYRADVVLLQETHLTLGSNIKLYSPDFPLWFYGDTISKRARGVAIGIAKGIRFVLTDRLTDPEGRFLFLRGKLEEEEYTLVNIYAPNTSPMKYLQGILGKLKDFRRGKIILGGDLNFCMDTKVDKTHQTLETQERQLRKVKGSLHRSQLVDTWRIFNPSKRDYTFYSHVHESYSRIDHIFIEHRMLDAVVETKIETMTISDHAPISISINIIGNQRTYPNWRLNEKLLIEEKSLMRVKKRIRGIF